MNDNIPASSNFHAIPVSATYHALPLKDKAKIQQRLHFLERFSNALGLAQRTWGLARQTRILDEVADSLHVEALRTAGQVLSSLAEELSELADQKLSQKQSV
jgi:hypothetical protein